MKMNRFEKIIVTATLLLGVTFAAQAEFMTDPTENVPMARLIANVQKQVERNPKDPQWHYALGRLHSMLAVGITNGVTPKPAAGNRDECLPFFETHGGDFTWRPQAIPPATKSTDAGLHFEKAITEYRQTIQLQTNHVYAWLGLAWCSQQTGNKDTAVGAYRKAHELAWAE